MIKQNIFSRKNAKSTLKTLTVHQIDIFEKNPRRSRNPNFEEIKESIRNTGLQTPFSVTKRPGDKNYVVKAGGNTRLAILKELYNETGDDRFKSIKVIFEPFLSDHDNLICHLIENEMRGDLTLLERSLALREARTGLEAELGRKLSGRETAHFLSESGFSISPTTVSSLNYALDKLYPHMPVYLDLGMGKVQVERIRKFENQAKQAWEDMEVSLEQFDEVFTASLAACTDEIEEDTPPRFEFEVLVKHFCIGTAQKNDIGLAQVQFFVDRAISMPQRPSLNDRDESKSPLPCQIDKTDHRTPLPPLDHMPLPRTTTSALELAFKAASETQIHNIHICLSFKPGAKHQIEISSPQRAEFSIDVPMVDLNNLCELVKLDQQIHHLSKAADQGGLQ